MSRLSRLHTAVVLALLALVPLAPVVLWLYAQAASVDRAPIAAANERVFRSVPHVPGARLATTHVYGIPRWGWQGGLVPTAGYRTEFFLRLRRPLRPSAILAHYRRVLAAWQPQGNLGTSFARGSVRIDIAVIAGHAGRTSDYGFYVSQ